MRAVLLVAVVALGAIACDDSCQERIMEAIPSPNRQYLATISHRSCGATVRAGTMVRLTDPQHGWSERVLGGRMQRGTIGDSAGGPRIDARWVAADTLEVGYDSTMEYADGPSSVHDVSIRYRPGSWGSGPR